MMTSDICYNSQRFDMTKKKTAKNPAAVSLGRRGGQANTPAQQKARKRNAKLAGRPRRVCTTCGEPVLGGGVHKDRALDATCKGRDWEWQKPSERPDR